MKDAHLREAASRFAGLTRARRILVVASVAAVLAGVTAVSATGVARAGGKAPVPQGIAAAVLPGDWFGDTPADTPESVSFILQANDLGGLEARVNAGMPGGFLGVSQFAHEYGQSQGNIAALEHYLAGYGISTHAMADGLDVQATGTAGQFDAALSVQQHNYHVPALPSTHGHPGHPGGVAHGTKQTPLLPKNLARFTLAVLGLTNWPTQDSNMIGVPKKAVPKAGPNTQLLPADFANQYDLNPVYAAGGDGHGTTVGIVTLANVDPTIVSQFWNDIGLTGSQASASRVGFSDVDGGSGPVSDYAGSGETTLDVQQSGALAPGANVRVYDAPNTDNGFVDAFFQAASENVADSVSSSWGESETVVKYFENGGGEDPNYLQSFDEAFLELAAQGQSAFTSSGDAGAYDDYDELGSTDLTVDTPGSSPWITAAGGTTLPGTLNFNTIPSVTIPSERAWGWDYLWPLLTEAFGGPEIQWAEAEAAGDGGGYSTLESMPGYQRAVRGTNEFSAVPYLTPIDPVQANGLTLDTDFSFNGSPSVIHGHGNGGRAVPDVSTDADPETGYLEYYTFDIPGYDDCGADADANGACYQQWGGTSFVAPQLNGATAALDSALGHRVGFWNPSVYRFATQHDSPFTPLNTAGTSNDNLYYTGTPGTLYNPATGLGTPDFAKLAADFGLGHHYGPHGPGHDHDHGH